ncbi:hypothetical protein [Halocynthiibacter namhaensis]|uniref:hypothetical protein n=1 Tax=Halocynthiibacter namhaensis TaxID=1290553 RepID=UPI000A714484|nr:hypothetical protein [Halocynthiibacter namhaensis]
MTQVTTARVSTQDRNRFLGFAFATLAMATLAFPLKAQDDVITSHGISPFGNLNLPADYTHLPYVNDQAPKGGEISTWAPGSFDSMNPYSTKGRAGALSSVMYERLMDSTSDELDALYGWVAESLTEPPRFYRRVVGSNIKLLFQRHSRLHRSSPLLHGG